MKAASTGKSKASDEREQKRAAARERVRKHREALRAQGLRPIQIWVPDTRRPGFAEEARRQSLAVRDDPQEKEVLDWIEKAMDYSGWE
ncbi:MAG: antitoxin MazE family protein [Acidobacteriales bacterium]|nr:antitoxin MazE family protein [Terriglobales bacterium]